VEAVEIEEVTETADHTQPEATALLEAEETTQWCLTSETREIVKEIEMTTERDLDLPIETAGIEVQTALTAPRLPKLTEVAARHAIDIATTEEMIDEVTEEIIDPATAKGTDTTTEMIDGVASATMTEPGRSKKIKIK
jgi:hypothetical protein